MSSNDTIQVVSYDETNEYFSLDVEGLEHFLLDSSIAEKKVCVISVAGAFRRGKSFFLNFLVRYLLYVEKYGFSNTNSNHQPDNVFQMKNNAKYDSGANNCDDVDNVSTKSEDETLLYKESLPDWLTKGDETLERVIKGFKWRGGSKRETNGIVLYKKPFIINTPSHGEVVVLLMDTQGTFDWSSTVKNCATIFALSTMLSSVQLFNITHNIQEDDLNHLQFFTEYGRLVLEQSESKPFQQLIFLVRDWSFDYEYHYGPNKEFLDSILTVKDNQPKELQSVREHIKDCFENIECVLLPYPGEAVASKVRFKGHIDDISPRFLKFTSDLVVSLVEPANIEPKKVEGKCFTCNELFYYFKTYIKIFQSDILPEPRNILEATAEAGHLVAYKDAQEYYIREMNQFCGGDNPYVSADTLKMKHQQIRSAAVELFEGSKKMGCREYHDMYLEKLETTLEERFNEFEETNEAKNILKTFRFVVVIFVVFIGLLVFSETLELIGLQSLNYPFVFIGRMCLILVFVWFYLRFTGKGRELLQIMNAIGDTIWNSVMDLIFKNASANIGMNSKSKVQ